MKLYKPRNAKNSDLCNRKEIMKMKNLQKITCLYLFLCCTVLLSVTSCKKVNNEIDSINYKKNNKKKFYNNDAELLSKFKMLSSYIISFNNDIKKEDISFSLNSTMITSVNQQKQITNKIDNLATRKLIIVPNSISVPVTDIKNVKTYDDLKFKYLETSYLIINQQIEILSKLEESSLDYDIINLALETKLNLEDTLHSLDDMNTQL
jgi:hypothetical protein